jgi:hypothetical protein
MPSCEGETCDEFVSAFCEVSLPTKSDIDIELDYLPNVLACENEWGSLESLKAQAITARSYLYYKLERGESLTDGEGDQVYSCGRTPAAKHFQAVEETSGLVLRYRGTQVAAFFVAGAKQTSSTCTGGTEDPTRTERYVTYNQGLSGNDIEQTRLGFRHERNFANRGCMSQHGANCHAVQGRSVEEIIRFYYGADIEVATAVGECIIPGATFDGRQREPETLVSCQSGDVIGQCINTDTSSCEGTLQRGLCPGGNNIVCCL